MDGAVDIRPLRVDELEQMVAAGILAEDEPVQLLEGALVVVSPQGPIHAGLITQIHTHLTSLLPKGWLIRVQMPLWVSETSLPEPDLAVIPFVEDFYASRHPRAAETRLAIEVAHTSQDLDRSKAELYARGGVVEYWLVDLPASRVEVYTEPRTEGRYVTTRVLGRGDTLESWLGHVEIDALLPRV